VESFLEHRLVVVWMRELKQNSRRCFREAEAALEVHLLADQRRSVHGELVRWREEKSSFGQEVGRIGELRVGVVVMIVLFLIPEIRPAHLRRVHRLLHQIAGASLATEVVGGLLVLLRIAADVRHFSFHST
jgi:hypothetical protein